MVRELQEKDVDEVAKIWLDTNLKAHDFIPARYWTDNFEMVRQMLGQAEVYIYEEKKEIQGFIGLQGDYIAGIFVRYGRQSGGIGKRLLDFVKRIKHELRLNVYQKNEKAVSFYRRENFSIQCEGIDNDTGEKEYVMIWKADGYFYKVD